jgi:four helix bundle protein
MTNAIRNFRDLDAWQSGMDLVLVAYVLSDCLPDRERYGLCAQMRRAAVSIPSNVAEGHAFRTNPKAFGRHVRIALGSLAELETQVEIGFRLKFLKPVNLKTIQGTAIRTGQLLHGLLRALNMRVRQTQRSECRVRATSFRSSRPLVIRERRRRTPKASVAKATKRR